MSPVGGFYTASPYVQMAVVMPQKELTACLGVISKDKRIMTYITNHMIGKIYRSHLSWHHIYSIRITSSRNVQDMYWVSEDVWRLKNHTETLVLGVRDDV